MQNEEEYQIGRRKSARIWRRKMRLGTVNPRCYICGWTDETFVTLLSAGKKVRDMMEGHHIEGNHEGKVMCLCNRCHTLATERQRDWSQILLYAQRNERIRLAAMTQGVIDVYEILLEQAKNDLEKIKKAITVDDLND